MACAVHAATRSAACFTLPKPAARAAPAFCRKQFLDCFEYVAINNDNIRLIRSNNLNDPSALTPLVNRTTSHSQLF